MRRFFIGIFTSIGIIAFLFVFTLCWSLYRLSSPSIPSVSSNEALVLTLTLGDQALVEHPHSGGLKAIVEGHPMSVHEIIAALNQATKDNDVKGILLSIEGNAFKIASVQEIRDAFKAFKASGKVIYTYTDTFGELHNATLAYYLAAATTKIWMMPLGTLNFVGLMKEVPFAKKALENLKINPQMGRREEYKGFIESITESEFSLPYKENTQRLIDALTLQIVTDVAADRGLSMTQVRNLLDTSPHNAKTALESKMIDEVGYKDQAKHSLEQTLGKKAIYYDFESYSHAQHEPSGKEKIAIIYAEGTISKGKMAHNPLVDEALMDASEIAKCLREAGEDNTIKAIILRIDSGGGDPIAVALIGHEVERVKSKKPVIVSMSNFAASGGYWIASNARKIVAQPGSLTGSIGVFAGKFVTQGFWENLGVHWDEIHSGNNAPIWSTGQNFSEKGRQKFNDYLDLVYATFQETVVKGRTLTPEQVHSIAKGQVWTGVEAKANGLVDVLGGLMTALEIAKQEAGIEPGTPVSMVQLPASKSIIELLFDRNQSTESQILARYPSLRMVLHHFEGLFSPPHIEIKTDISIP